ncbi:MAG: DUF2782 domain-containing protein [Gammaproteobacteria bacterium]|nr:DUF2782 domain-containing protein [Gammaproteobacteria bacterium]
MQKIIGLVLVLCSGGVWAQQDNVPAPPPIQENSDAPQVLQIEIPPDPVDVPEDADLLVRREGSNLIHEYRIRDRLVLMKVKPDNGPAYYISDPSGDGSLRDRPNEFEADHNMRKWKLGEW